MNAVGLQWIPPEVAFTLRRPGLSTLSFLLLCCRVAFSVSARHLEETPALRLPPRCAHGSAALLVLIGACSQPAEDSKPAATTTPRPTLEQATQKADIPSPQPPARLPDPYRAPALGLRFEKPTGWEYLPETNHPDPLAYAARLSPFELRRALRDLTKPVVSMVRRAAEGAQGAEATFSVYYRAAGEPDFLQEFYSNHPEAVANSNAQSWLTRPEAEIVEPARVVQVGGLQGAVIRLRYVETDTASGARNPVEVRIWNVRRDQAHIYLEARLQDPASADRERDIEDILGSFELDPPLSPATTPGSPAEPSRQAG